MAAKKHLSAQTRKKYTINLPETSSTDTSLMARIAWKCLRIQMRDMPIFGWERGVQSD
jgi:hypothetical protein